MKHMKAKIVVSLFLLFLLAFTSEIAIVQAEEDKKVDELEPMIYEKLKFKKNTDYLHDGKKMEMKNTIPTKQFDIYFDGRKKLPNRSDTSYLFQTANRGEISTVAAKSLDLKLFSNDGNGDKELSSSPSSDGQAVDNRTRTIILLTIIAVGLAALFMIVIPKLVYSSDSPKGVREGE